MRGPRTDMGRALLYFEQSLSEQAFRNLMAMTNEEFVAFTDYFNNKTGDLGRKIGATK